MIASTHDQYVTSPEVGPGYRIYFGKEGDRLIVLLGGGTKRRQQNDVDMATTLWQEYKRRKRQQK